MIRLLIVEDEPRMSEALGELLRREGYEVCVCTDGKQGMIAIVDRDYDAAILDVMLPGASGFEIAAAARQAGRSLPILMLTARDAVEDKVIGLDSGADDYLTMDGFDLLCLHTGQSVRLTPKEAKHLDALIETDGRTITRELLAVRAYGYQENAEYNNVEVYLTFLRRKLKFIGSGVEIKARRGLGYQIREDAGV